MNTESTLTLQTFNPGVGRKGGSYEHLWLCYCLKSSQFKFHMPKTETFYAPEKARRDNMKLQSAINFHYM